MTDSDPLAGFMLDALKYLVAAMEDATQPAAVRVKAACKILDVACRLNDDDDGDDTEASE